MQHDRDRDDAAVPDALPVGRAAARLGVAASTLRTWDRRYGLSPTARSAGGHRRYSPADLEVLRRMGGLLRDGLTPARAAALARSAAVAPSAQGATEDGTTREGASEDGAPGDGARQRPGGPGGRVLSLPGAGSRARGLARAATALDADAATELVRDALARDGVLATWDGLVRPVLAAAGSAWARTGQGVEVEHLLSGAVLEALSLHARTARTAREQVADGPAPAPVVLACAPNDQHSLPLHALAAALAERGVPARVLGAQVPPEALAGTIRRTGARTAFVWAQLPDAALPDVLAGLPVTRPRLRLVLGGPGWAGTEPPDGGARVDDLGAAVDAILAA